MSLPKEKLDELEAVHKRIAHVKGAPDPRTGEPAWEVVLRAPKRIEYKMYRKNILNPAAASDAQETIVKQIAVYPEGLAAVDALIDQWPGLTESAAMTEAIKQLTGMASDELAK